MDLQEDGLGDIVDPLSTTVAGSPQWLSERTEVAEFLLRREYFLTALEFYQETLEEGHEVPLLKEYFHDNHLFPSQDRSITPTLAALRAEAAEGGPSTMATSSVEDDEDYARGSTNFAARLANKRRGTSTSGRAPGAPSQSDLAALKEKSQRIVLLEHELKQARKDIMVLQDRLQCLSTLDNGEMRSETGSRRAVSVAWSSSGQEYAQALIAAESYPTVDGFEEPMRDYERKVIDRMVRKYLIDSGRKVSAVAVTEEINDRVNDEASSEGGGRGGRDNVLERFSQVPLLLMYRMFKNKGLSPSPGAGEWQPMEALDGHGSEKPLLDPGQMPLSPGRERREEEMRSIKERALRYERECLDYQITVDKLKKEKEILVREIETCKVAMHGLVEKLRLRNHAGDIPSPPQTLSPPSTEVVSPSKPPPYPTQGKIKDTRSEKPSIGDDDDGDGVMTPGVRKVLGDAAGNIEMLLGSSNEAASIIREVQDTTPSSGNIVKVLGVHLPLVIPHVLLNRRHELIPLLIHTIRAHLDPGTRDQLTHRLFNLVRRPSEIQRDLIIDGCSELASMISDTRIEEELLPHCWEQMNHKFEERRILVAGTCGALGRFVREETRNSLLFSILRQMMGDRAEDVRKAAAAGFSKLMHHLQTDEKYEEIETCVWRLLDDSSTSVVSTVENMLMPSMTEWTDRVNCLTSKLLPNIVRRIEDAIFEDIDDGGNGNGAFFDARIEVQNQRQEALFTAFVMMAPNIHTATLRGMPVELRPRLSGNGNDGVAYTEEGCLSLSQPVSSLYDLTAEAVDFRQNVMVECARTIASMGNQYNGALNWPTLEWVVRDLYPRLLVAVSDVDSNETPYLALGLSRIVRGLCVHMGMEFTRDVVYPLFADAMKIDSGASEGGKQEQQLKLFEIMGRGRILPVLMTAVLPCMEEEHMTKFIREVIVDTSLERNGWIHGQIPMLIDACHNLCQTRSLQRPILSILWELTVHPAPQVRATVVTLFRMLVNIIGSHEVIKRVFPALVTLSSDRDKAVRLATIAAFANVCQNVSNQQVIEKIIGHLEGFLEDDSHDVSLEVLRAYTSLIPTSEPDFRENYLLERLVDFFNVYSKNSNLSRRAEIYAILVEAYRALSGLPLSTDCIFNMVVPMLRALQADLHENTLLDVPQRSAVGAMIQEMSSAETNNQPRRDSYIKEKLRKFKG